MKPNGPILFGALIVGAALYLSHKRAQAADAKATPSQPIRNGLQPSSTAINTNPELWTTLGLDKVREGLSNGQALQIPNFGRARITDTEDARLYGAVLPSPQTFDERGEDVWRRAAPAITQPIVDLMSFWTGTNRTQPQIITADVIKAREPRPQMIPLPGDLAGPRNDRARWNAVSNPLAPDFDQAQVAVL